MQHFTIPVYLLGSTPEGQRVSMKYYANVHSIPAEKFLGKYDMYLFLETFSEAFGDMIDDVDESFMDGNILEKPLPDEHVSLIFDAATHQTVYNAKADLIKWEVTSDDD